jgi:putative membrane-bound dehydrogenase-like protein
MNTRRKNSLPRIPRMRPTSAAASRRWPAVCLVLGGLLGAAGAADGRGLELRKGDHICLVGNELGERMQHHNYWESLLHTRFPDLQLVVRNLCFPADEPLARLRSLNFGTPDDHLTHSRADVILYFFGFNESFSGEQGLPAFTEDLTQLIRENQSKNYSGNGPPRIVLISPIAHENLHSPHLPDGRERNAVLAGYTAAMRDVAEKTGAGFVDLFAPTSTLFEQSSETLTLNGVHLNDDGYRALAPILDRGLFGEANAPQEISERLRAEIADKNFHWWHRYRAVNGYSIYGKRGEAGSDGTYRNREVMERERVILDQMCAIRDQRIWQIAQGQVVPDPADDGGTLPFIEPKTNVGGVDDPNRKNGKLGSLDYIPAAEQQKYFKLQPGYEINLVASEEQFPELANPVALSFDHRGRLWVSVMPSYPQWKPKTKMDDRLLILEDHNADGRADQCKVFAGGLHQPTGFELGNGGVYVAQQPDILFLRDTDGDDRADERTRLLVGFDTADSHHGLAAFEWGPDGGLYFQEGTFKQSQVESPYGPVRLSDAGVWRYHPRNERMEVHVSLAFANPWGHVFDRWGQNFVADASPGFNYWATPISGHVPFPDKHPGGSRTGHLDWGGSKSDREYPVFIKKRTRPSSGCEIVSSRHFPPEAQGNFLVNNVIGELGILQHTVREEGSGFTGDEITPLVMCDHGNFRPVDLQFGPDGALYIVDWHNALIGHLQHNLREPFRDHSHGRIWRITYFSRPLVTPPRIAGQPIPALLELLREPEDRTRYRVRRELAERDPQQVLAAVDHWVAQLDANDEQHEHLLLEALWLCQTHDVVHQELLQRVLESADHRARAAATRVASHWRFQLDDLLPRLAPRIHDAHPRVRLEAVRACSFIARPESIELVLDVLNYEMDYYLEYTLDETIRVLEDEIHRATPAAAHADHANHANHADHGDQHQHHLPPQARPIVFLDKSPQVVQFQLARLSPSQLLSIERTAGEARYAPVFEEISVRPGVSRQDRQEALEALQALRGTSLVAETLRAIARVGGDKQPQQAMAQLADILLRQESAVLQQHVAAFRESTSSDSDAVRAVGYAGLMVAGQAEAAWKSADASRRGRRDFLDAVPLIPQGNDRAALRGRVVAALDESQPVDVRRAAIAALASIPVEQRESFSLVAPLVDSAPLQKTAVAALLQIPREHRPPEPALAVVKTLVTHAENTPPAQRTTPDFLDAMHLAEELLAALSADQGRSYRQRLREVVVRVVRINTVHEEMRYDTAYFAVEAGRPVQLVLRNIDLMPHNLVLTAPGKLKDVALEAAALPPEISADGKQYVPSSPDVLFATRMVPSNAQDVLTFTAPREPGEYPYVCTFPNHWMRMYGVMLVVPDLEAWQASPTIPADPLGIQRSMVKSWSMEDFSADLDDRLEGRTPDIGRRIFQEASCAQCHKLQGQGGAVGPDLSDVLQRWKGDQRAVLREILDPSHKVEPKYALYNLLTADGRVISGVITAQDAQSITVVTNPENPQPVVIPRDQIEDSVKSSASMMPKGLMDRFTEDEILELLALLVRGASAKASP